MLPEGSHGAAFQGETMQEPTTIFAPEPVDGARQAKPSKTKLYVAVGASAASLLVGLLAGVAMGQVPVKALESEVAYQKTRVASMVTQIETGKSEAEVQVAAAEAKAKAAEDASAAKEAELDTRAEELAAQETEAKELQETLDAAVVAREESKIGSGLHEVGVDVQPGKYKTSGPDGSNMAGCYYAWKTSFGADADIIDNELTDGKATVVLKKGQFFEVDSCNEFVKQ